MKRTGSTYSGQGSDLNSSDRLKVGFYKMIMNREYLTCCRFKFDSVLHFDLVVSYIKRYFYKSEHRQRAIYKSERYLC